MTRKGLAFGAGLALVTSGLVATPATASEVLTLAPSTGTSYNSLAQSDFALQAGFLASVTQDNASYLKYVVRNPDEFSYRLQMAGAAAGTESFIQTGTANAAATRATVTITDYAITDGGAGQTDTITFNVASTRGIEVGDLFKVTTNLASTGTAGAAAAATAANGAFTTTQNTADFLTVDGVSLANNTISVIVPELTFAASVADTAITVTAGVFTFDNIVSDDSFVVNPQNFTGTNRGAIGSANTLTLSTLRNNGDSSITVQAWLDTDNDNTVDAGEPVSPVRTVNFRDISRLSGTISVGTPLIGATTLAATLTLTGDINYQQIDAGDVRVNFAGRNTAYGTDLLTEEASWAPVTATYGATSASISAVAAGEAFRVRLLVDNNQDGDLSDDGDIKAFATTTAASALTSPTYRMSVVASANAVTTAAAENDPGTDATDFATTQSGTAAVRTGTTSFSVSIFVGTDVATPIGVASRPVRVAVSGSASLTNTDAVVTNGVAVVNQAAAFTVTTGTTGVATFDVNLGSADAGDTITFTGSLDGNAQSALTVTVTDGDYTLHQLVTGNPSIREGAALSIEYGVVDQFGVAPANNTMSVLVAPTVNERTTAADWSHSLAVVAGRAVLNVTDNGRGVGRFTAAARLVVNGTSTAVANGTVNTVVNVVADPVPARVTLRALTYGTSQANDANNDGDFADTGDTDNTARLLLESRAFANYDSRFAIPTASAPTVRDTHKVVVSGTVTNAAGTAIAGAPVTFAAKGFLFKSGTRFVMDSITVHAGSTGIASVEAWSQVGGAQKVTITSGTATVDQALTFEPGTATAASFDITTVATSMPGKTVDVKVTVKDRFGNPAQGVTVALRSTGPGYLLQTSISTDRLGEAFTKLLVGASESGSAVVTATMTIAGVETSKAATVVIGGGAEAKIGSFNGRVAVRVENGQGSTVSVKIGRQWYKFNSLNDNYLWSVRSVKGRSVAVSVYINGDLQNVQTITVR